MSNEKAPKVIQEFPSFGPCSATLSPDGSALCVDFVSSRDPSTALRMVFPADALATLQEALEYLAQQMKDPASALRLKQH